VAFLRILLTWIDQVREDSTCTPNNLKELTRSMVPRGVVRSGKFILARGPIMITLVLELLTCMWLFAVHVIKFVVQSQLGPANTLR